MGINAGRQVDVTVEVCGCSLLVASIFSVKQEVRSSTENEDRRTDFKDEERKKKGEEREEESGQLNNQDIQYNLELVMN